MDDYYELLGVETNAPVDDIRAAYREKKAAIDTSAHDSAKADVAALNKAWNVLSDPYQRGRYDQQRLDSGEGAGPLIEGDDDGAPAPVARRREPRANDRADKRRKAREPLKPTIELPPRTHFASMRHRMTAMVIDLFVLLVLFIGSQFFVSSQERAQHPAIHHDVTTVLPNKIDKANSASSKADKAASTADKALAQLKLQTGVEKSQLDAAQATATAADNAAKHAKDEVTALNKQLTKESNILAPISRLYTGLFFVVALLYLLVPSILFNGQTLGKRLQKVRVAHIDGSKASAGEVFRRYGVLVVVAYMLFAFLGPIAAVVVLFVSTRWTSNANKQGLHDRFARTLVVVDEQP